MGTWKSKNRHKYLLQYHIIFVCKYRKKSKFHIDNMAYMPYYKHIKGTKEVVYKYVSG